MKEKLLQILENFKGKRILVIGDIMLDKYIWGNVSRISPEAPVQIVNVEKENYVPGGAANVANNVSSLNGAVFMVGIVGKDNEANILSKELIKRNINTEGIFVDEKKPTTQKVRILGQKQQLLRIDYEKKEYVNKETEEKLLNFIKEKISNIDAIIIPDYAKGVITKNLIKGIHEIVKLSNVSENGLEKPKGFLKDKIIIVDPKPKHKDFYKNVSLITPNIKEAKEMTNKEDIREIGKQLMAELDTPILITRGEKGMFLFEKTETTNIPTKAKEVYDVSGAGDTVVATLALALTTGATLKQAAILANHAAGIIVGKVGTSTVSIEEIKGSLENE